MDVVLRRGSAPVCLGSAPELWFGSRWTVAVAWARGVDDGHGRPVWCRIGGAQATRAGSPEGAPTTEPGPESVPPVLAPWTCMSGRSTVAAVPAHPPPTSHPSMRIKRNVVLEGHRIGCRCDLSCCLSCELQSVATMYTPNGQQNIFLREFYAFRSRCRSQSIRLRRPRMKASRNGATSSRGYSPKIHEKCGFCAI